MVTPCSISPLPFLFHPLPLPSLCHADIALGHTAGFPAMPPLWALGFHLCRWGYGSSNETWQTARAMRNFQIPQVPHGRREGWGLCAAACSEPIPRRMHNGTTLITWTGTGTSPSIPRNSPPSPHWWKISTSTGSTT